ncbi:chitinase C-terminal domain-containing protein [Kibdelosporangium phytohabitans]|uniref:Chitinase n=1 Tax=Kibdelosporangium phytohabitans TaxID=860235 RepID=A0A0N9IDF3_9PSEU|nr:glycosyl hydrolase family 18 protein [Kibdelosporangium phytohabitans]ALG12763.1 chitinase [Kibdelosporangium phytohabitans]MBE1464439.1 chitinase [Kibdelosporangium phytohabitans]
MTSKLTLFRLSLIGLIFALAGLFALAVDNRQAAAADDCRPDGLATTAGVTVPYCTAYDAAGREKLANGNTRRVIGYFTSWRTGKDGSPRYLAGDIPWSKVTHINYAFAHVGTDNKVSVGPAGANNPATGMEWPGVPGAEMDPSLSYKGHFNLLTKYKKQHPDVKTLISIGGWAETGGFLNPDGTRTASGGFYKMAQSQAAIDTFADSVVAFLRQYGFSGADIDYEYATSANYAGNPDDYWISQTTRGQQMTGYVNLMRTLRSKLDAASAADGKHYLLTAAVSSSGWLLRGAETYQVTQYLDFVNLMSYDLHGAWNHFVGPNAPLFDDGNDAELKHWQVYTAAQYEGVGYLNTDWAYHYFRGAMPAGRINIGVPFYTRGWQGVNGGNNGLWGTAALPDQKKCPPGTGSSVGSTVPCGNGAIGIDNLWHDSTAGGAEVPSGVNPMWHAKNLERGVQGDYLAAYGLDPVNDPTDRLTGTYARNYNNTLTAPWLWNAQKKVFLSTEDETSIAAKAKYVADKGIGGVMIWELSGDYAFDSAKNQYFMGTTLIDALDTGLRNAAPYGASKSNTATPANLLDVGVTFSGFALGDSNYPINPKMKITNRSTTTIPGGAVLEFDYGTSAPGSMSDQSGFGLRVTQKGHSGPNAGGLKGDFQHVSVTVPSWQSIAPGASVDVAVVYQLPIATPGNFKLTFGGKSYALTTDHPRGGGGSGPPPTDPPPGPCTAPAWASGTVYASSQLVSHKGHNWRNKWWTQGQEPGTNAVWTDQGAC